MSRREGCHFRFVEVLFVFAVVFVLLGLLMPAVHRGTPSRRIVCLHQMRQWGLAVLNYETENERFPGSQELVIVDVANAQAPAKSIPVTWMGAVLKYCERSDLADAAKGGAALRDSDYYIDIAVCPSMPNIDCSKAWNSYVANAGFSPRRRDPAPLSDLSYMVTAQRSANGIFLDRVPQSLGGRTFGGAPAVRLPDIRDGTSSTIMISENIQAGSWTQVGPLDYSSMRLTFISPFGPMVHPISTPQRARFFTTFVWLYAKETSEAEKENPHVANGNSIAASLVTPTMKINGMRKSFPQGQGPQSIEAARPSAYHPGSVNVIFADNSGMFLSDKIDYHVYQQLMTPHGVQSDMPYRRRTLRESDYHR